MPTNAVDVISQARACQVPWVSLSPLVREVIKLGGEISYIEKINNKVEDVFPRFPLPSGHRFFPDHLREQEARLLEWLIRTYPGNCWFFTATFKDWTHPDRAYRLIDRFLARLGQAHKEVSGAALLKSFLSTEWQQRSVIHFHLLIFGDRLGSLSRKRWEFRWRMISGGFAADYDAELKAAPYLVKHQIKDNPDDALHVGGSWRGITPPKSVSCCCSSVLNGFRGVEKAFYRASRSTALESSCQD